MLSLRDVISAAAAEGQALWHFNFSELTVVKAAARLVHETGSPIILGLSEGEREFIGMHEAVALVRSYRARGIPLYLNADHTKSFEGVRAAIEAGFDAVIFDGSALPIDENIRETKRAVEYARLVDPKIMIEGELGYIGVNSKVLDAVPEGVEKASVEDAVRFVKEAGVDMLAPAVGNIHGMLKSGNEPKLDIGLIREIKEALRQAPSTWLRTGQGKTIPMVLHGASGNTDEDISAAIAAGISIIHINTEIRVAWRSALEGSLRDHPDEAAPYKLLAESEDAAYAVMKEKIGWG